MRPKIMITALALLLVNSWAYADEYFRLGDWTLGAKAKDVLAGAAFQDVREIKKNEHYEARVRSGFSESTPIILYFKRGWLERTQLTLYEAGDYAQSRERMKDVLRVFESQFGGANLEGLTTTEGLKVEMVDLVIGQVMDKIITAVQEINLERKNGEPETFFNLYIGMSTEKHAAKNSLYAKYSYFGDTGIYNVSLYEDREFNKAHVAPTMIYLDTRKGADRKADQPTAGARRETLNKQG